MSDFLVDVLIPAYNVASTIESAVASIQGQTVQNIRIVVVDDGSTDDTGAILARMAALDTRIYVITQPNAGIVDALNNGLAACTAPFVARHDGDDLASPDRFALQLAYLDANPDCVAVGSAARQMDADGRDLGTVAELADLSIAEAKYIPSREPYLIHPFLMARRAAMEKAGGYRYVYYAEDTDLYWRLQEVGRLHNMSDVLGSYRIHTSSITSSVLNGRISAVHSQLSALSAERRRSGKADMVFPRAALADYKAAASLQKIWEVASRDLQQAEAAWLRLALAVKLLELAGYRPYELDTADCEFIRGALVTAAQDMSADNWQQVRRTWAGTVSRLVMSRKFAQARALSASQIVPSVMGRLVFRSAIPPNLRRQIRQLMGRNTYYK